MLERFYIQKKSLMLPSIPNGAKYQLLLQSYWFPRVSGYFSYFLLTECLETQLKQILNSWRNEKLSPSMTLNQQYFIFIWKLTLQIYSFFSVRSLRQSYPHWLYFTFFHFALENITFQGRNFTGAQWPCLWE